MKVVAPRVAAVASKLPQLRVISRNQLSGLRHVLLGVPLRADGCGVGGRKRRCSRLPVPDPRTTARPPLSVPGTPCPFCVFLPAGVPGPLGPVAVWYLNPFEAGPTNLPGLGRAR